ncbi:MAG: sigma 54-interacting transcriptional regulator [Deltaproteobacteria bacterium]|nr:sigma 54-interacting transcriptional regulator [Deltaproteobacteria bacterium]
MNPSTLANLTDYQSILNSITDGVFTINSDMIITSFNLAAERITRVTKDEAIGRKCFEVMRSESCESGCCIKKTIETGQPCENVPVYIVRADNKRIPISVNTTLLKDEDGNVIGGVETFRDLSEINNLRRAYQKKHAFEDIVSKNHEMLQLFAILPQIAKSHSTVLIEGPSGTGKELFARAIHNHSPQSKSPFVEVHCGALPDTLIESELFGYQAGAFTDAKQNKPGRFALAGNGTIFLDEIGDISPAMQMRLLRVLENRTYTPLGATNTHKMNARVIAATHRDLEQMVAEKRFRQDLYFRINIVRLRLPKLAERKEDIPLLTNHFIEHFNTITGKQILGIAQDALTALVLHDWPGNVRELENAIEHAFVLCRDNMLRLEYFPEQIHASNDPAQVSAETTLKQIEKQAIIRALIKNNWRRMATSRELGIDKNTLRRKIQRHDIKIPEQP